MQKSYIHLCIGFFKIYAKNISINCLNSGFRDSMGPNIVINDMNEVHMIEQVGLTFDDHTKYFKETLNSGAITIIL